MQWAGIAHRYYYRSKSRSPKVNEELASRIKRVIETLPCCFGLSHNRLAGLLGENKNTVQRIFSGQRLAGQKKEQSGARPRVQSLPSIANRPNERWATDMARVWCGLLHRWCALTIVMDCHTRNTGLATGSTGSTKLRTLR